MSLQIPVDDLVRWNDNTARGFRDLLHAEPVLMTTPTGIRDSGTLARVLQHIVAVELRYAQRLASEPESSYDEVPFDSPDAIFDIHHAAFTKIRALLNDDAYDWSQEIEFQTITMGRLRATRRDALLHMLFHGIRHYAQLASLVREHGAKPGWAMDFLFLNAQPADPEEG